MPDDDYEVNTGGDDASPPNPQQPPQPDLSKFESRLNGITEALSSFQREQQQRDHQQRITSWESQVVGRVRATQQAVNAAERDYAQAVEDGDSAAIAKANRNIAERVADRERAANAHEQFKRAMKDAEARQGGSSGAPGANPQPPQQGGQQGGEGDLDFQNLNRWKDRHKSWYGVDTEMTKAAHEVDWNIREAGAIPVGSTRYFEAIDRAMAHKFPDRLGGAPQTGGGGTGRQPSQAQAGSGRIPRDVVDGWRRMGINVNDNATIERMVKNRRALADKGILPSEPAYGSVVTR